MARSVGLRVDDPLTIIPARASDLGELAAIEQSAAWLFRENGLAWVAAMSPLPLKDLQIFMDATQLWIAVDNNDSPVGFVAADVMDGDGFVYEISVRREVQNRGIGRRLLDVVEHWARAAGYTRLTLTTYRDLAWNAPLYRKLGYQIIATDELGPGLRGQLIKEAEHGHDPARRCAMMKLL